MFLSSVDRFHYQAKQSQQGPGFRVGPGSYQPENGVRVIRKREDTGVPKIQRLTVDQT